MSFCFFPTFYICIKCERKEASPGKATSRKQQKKILVLQSRGRLPMALPCRLQKKKKSKYYVYAFKLTQSADLTKDRDAQEIFCAKLLQRKRDKEVWKVSSKAGRVYSPPRLCWDKSKWKARGYQPSLWPHWMCLDALYSSCRNSESPVRLKDERSFAEVLFKLLPGCPFLKSG